MSSTNRATNPPGPTTSREVAETINSPGPGRRAMARSPDNRGSAASTVPHPGATLRGDGAGLSVPAAFEAYQSGVKVDFLPAERLELPEAKSRVEGGRPDRW